MARVMRAWRFSASRSSSARFFSIFAENPDLPTLTREVVDGLLAEMVGAELARLRDPSVEHAFDRPGGGQRTAARGRPDKAAANIDPQSACKIDPPERHGGGCPGSQ